MYNRYIPQPDGSYRRNRMPDPYRSTPPRNQPPPKESCPSPPEKVCPPPPEKVCPPPPKPIPPKPEPKCPRQEPGSFSSSIGGFLRHLLPKDFDTSDLIVVLLLILMAGDRPEDQNTALLTLAIYLFL